MSIWKLFCPGTGHGWWNQDTKRWTNSEINVFSRCLENGGLFSVLVFVCSYVCLLCFYRKAPWGREDLLFGLGNKIGVKFLCENFWVGVAISVIDRRGNFVPRKELLGRLVLGWNSEAVTKSRLVPISSDFQLGSAPLTLWLSSLLTMPD